MCPKVADGTANSEDPDQTAWVYTVCIGLSVGKLRNMLVLLIHTSLILDAHTTFYCTAHTSLILDALTTFYCTAHTSLILDADTTFYCTAHTSLILDALTTFYWHTCYMFILFQVLGHKEGLNVMERADPLFLLIGLPTIPVMLILGKMVRWEDYLLRLWRKHSSKLPLLNYLFPDGKATTLSYKFGAFNDWWNGWNNLLIGS